MIGKWLDQLSNEAADDVLTTTMRPYHTARVDDGGRCLVGVAGNAKLVLGSRQYPSGLQDSSVVLQRRIATISKLISHYRIGTRYDFLCERFGTAQVNRLIRDRLLKVRCRRELLKATVQTETCRL